MSVTRLNIRFSVADLGATLVGVVNGPGGVTLIDSGLDDRHAKKLEKILDVPVEAVYHTHTHADHVGGSAYFAGQRGAKIYVPAEELSFARMPELEGALLFGGVSPAAARKPFLMAKPVEAQAAPAGVFLLYGGEVKPVKTPGHSPGHLSYMFGDTLFLGDALFSPEVIGKHGVLYLYDPLKAFNSLETVETLNFSHAVLCHKGIIGREECGKYINYQREHIRAIARLVLKHALGLSSEGVAVKVLDELGIKATPEQWLLALSTIKGYLSALERRGRVKMRHEGEIYWETAG